MLPKVNRLKKKKDLERVFKKGKRFKEDLLLLKIIKNNLELIRFGFVVSQKVSKKATVRNKIKRRLRAIIGRKIKKNKTGLDILFIVLPGLEKKKFQDVEKIINKLLQKTRIKNG